MSTPAYWDDACAVLSADDAVMAALIRQFDGSVLRTRGEPFETLLRAIVGQQISIAAADAIWNRLGALAALSDPGSLLSVSPEALRQAGLSQRKVEYAHDLARHFADGHLDPAHLALLDDEAIIVELTAVRGIGRWTAEMFLMFNLMRPDVWPVDDIGLQKAMARCYGHAAVPKPAELRLLGERWRPWRTVATWYLWRSLDATEVLY
ncbi:DNA-3-methyladenine glycosylase family protein [Paludibacterium purpuratum]|uniref:DNA-3-methyladenine glycosylase II n=1 Tax=Paludibacterium purpuratum TaxID=1144873 RepID=A0A4R7AUM8_9NEIS|nr:DNA-3-methyladenine glycosylase [Paludibacterium purpuratum]TDR70630.1 DNA-3-methyladenine glycosylase II [Paludibacterium purpuratum]